MFRALFIEIRRGLETLEIPEKSSLESSCPSRRLNFNPSRKKIPNSFRIAVFYCATILA
jgi:hypothetical protein